MHKNKLPKEFIELVKDVYPKKSQKVIESFSINKPTTFRINKLKVKDSKKLLEDLKKEGFKITKGPFDNTYIVKKQQKPLSKTEAFSKGLIYIQELSSMLPPLVLNPKKDEYILDMTAAPGSKTTQIAMLSKNKANLLAVEKNPIRYKKLKYNLKLQDAKVKTININSIILPKKFPEFKNFFDKILLDSPCSSEGRFNTQNPKTFKFWSIKKIKRMQKTQKILLNKAVEMLKPNGILVYSTCTLNKKENEEVLEWILKKHPNLKLESINLKIPEKNIVKGKTKNTKRALRILPDTTFGGFFIAKIRKTGLDSRFRGNDVGKKRE